MPTVNAALLARRLEDRRRWRARGAWRMAAIAAAGLIAALASARLLAPVAGLRGLLDGVLADPERSLAVVAILAGLRALRLRRRWLAERPRSWLGTLPITPAQAARADAWRLAGAQLAMLGALLAALAIAAVASGSVRDLPALAGLAGAGLAVGSLAGGLLGRRPARPRTSRALRTATPRERKPGSGSAVLAWWPLRQARAQADPGVHARVLGALLLTLPTGSSMAEVSALLLGLAGVLAASECLRGLLAAIGGSAGWLRGTAWPPRRLAATLIVPTLAVIGGIAAATGGVLAGPPAPHAAVAGALAGSLLAGGVALAAWCLHHPTRPDR